MAEIQILKTEQGRKPNRFRYTVNSASDARRHYVVTHDGNSRRWLCSCPAWIFRRIRCKHIKTVAAQTS